MDSFCLGRISFQLIRIAFGFPSLSLGMQENETDNKKCFHGGDPHHKLLYSSIEEAMHAGQCHRSVNQLLNLL